MVHPLSPPPAQMWCDARRRYSRRGASCHNVSRAGVVPFAIIHHHGPRFLLQDHSGARRNAPGKDRRMTRRSRAREVALQMLFQRDHNPKVERAACEEFARERLREQPLQEFCLTLYDGVLEHLEEIDRRLTAAADNWRLPRMATVDRNVLRLGAFELLFGKDTPTGVAFDEAIEVARRYGRADSAGLVNGVLDRLRRETAGPPVG